MIKPASSRPFRSLVGIYDLHGLLFEPIAEFVVDFADDFGAGLSEVVVGLGRFVDEDEGGFFVYAETVEEFTFEAALLDEPAGVDLVAVFAAVDGVAFVFGGFGAGFV